METNTQAGSGRFAGRAAPRAQPGLLGESLSLWLAGGLVGSRFRTRRAEPGAGQPVDVLDGAIGTGDAMFTTCAVDYAPLPEVASTRSAIERPVDRHCQPRSSIVRRPSSCRTVRSVREFYVVREPRRLPARCRHRGVVTARQRCDITRFPGRETADSNAFDSDLLARFRSHFFETSKCHPSRVGSRCWAVRMSAPADRSRTRPSGVARPTSPAVD